MNDSLSYAIFHALMNSLDSAFLARQGKGTCSPEEWGNRFFTHP